MAPSLHLSSKVTRSSANRQEAAGPGARGGEVKRSEGANSASHGLRDVMVASASYQSPKPPSEP